jgi:hypothetical protein
MNPRTRLPVCVVLCLLCAAGAFGAHGCRSGPVPPTFEADRFETEIVIKIDGSLDVHERITGRAVGAATVFERHVRSHHADGIAPVSAAIDGTPVPLDSGAPHPRDGTAYRARWTLPSGAAQTHTLEWRYTVTGAIAIESARGRLRWPLLAGDRRFTVNDVQVRLQVAAPGQLLGGSGMAEAEWTVARVPGGITAARSAVGLAPATLLAEVSIDPHTVTRPEWQVSADLQREFGPAFVAGALFMIVIGVGVIWIVWWRLRAHGPSDVERRHTADGFRTTAIAGFVFAALCAALAQWLLHRFGWLAQMIPASMMLVALGFGAAARVFRPRG